MWSIEINFVCLRVKKSYSRNWQILKYKFSCLKLPKLNKNWSWKKPKDEEWRMNANRWWINDEWELRIDEGWRIKDEGWKMKDEGWRIKDEVWRMEDEGWRIKDEV